MRYVRPIAPRSAPAAPSDDGRPYHHGDLRRALMAEALVATSESGPTGWSLRELTRRIGVSNAASTRHFRDKRSLMTALAVEGYDAFGVVLRAAWERRGVFADVGEAYVTFAWEHSSSFEIVCRPELYDAEDPAVHQARERVFAVLYGPLEELGVPSPRDAGVAAWSLVHGVATLRLQGLLPADFGPDAASAFRTVSRFMFQADLPPSSRSGQPRGSDSTSKNS